MKRQEKDWSKAPKTGARGFKSLVEKESLTWTHGIFREKLLVVMEVPWRNVKLWYSTETWISMRQGGSDQWSTRFAKSRRLVSFLFFELSEKRSLEIQRRDRQKSQIPIQLDALLVSRHSASYPRILGSVGISLSILRLLSLVSHITDWMVYHLNWQYKRRDFNNIVFGWTLTFSSFDCSSSGDHEPIVAFSTEDWLSEPKPSRKFSAMHDGQKYITCARRCYDYPAGISEQNRFFSGWIFSVGWCWQYLPFWRVSFFTMAHDIDLFRNKGWERGGS
jgi:hypothetical protein